MGLCISFKSTYEELECLGTGRFGKVFKGRCGTDGRISAVKRIHLGKRSVTHVGCVFARVVKLNCFFHCLMSRAF